MSNRGYQSTTINVQAVGSPTVVLEMIASGPRGPDGLATVKIQQVNSDGVYEELMRTAPYEYDKSDGIFKPPGEAIEPGRLRVEAEVTDLDTLATESSLIAVNDRLDTLVGKLESTLAEVETLVGKDYATQTTLAQVLDKLSSDPATASNQVLEKAVLETIAGKDFAKEETQVQVKQLLDTISSGVASRGSEQTLAQVKGELELVKAELQAIKANQLSGDQKVQLSGSTEVTFPAAQPVQLSGQVVTEQKLTENLEIAAGAEVRIGSNSGFPAQCNALSFGVLCDADAEIGITLWPVTFGAPASTYPTVLLDGSITTSNLRAVSPLWTPVSTYVSPRVRNNSGVPVTVSVVMYRWFNTQQ
jgi:hypothetical protein